MKVFRRNRLLKKFFSAGPHSSLIAHRSALLLRFLGLIVPRRLRADWRQEWEAELRWRENQLAEWDKLDWKNKLALWWYSAGAFADALWLQPKRWEDEMIQDLRLGIRMLIKHPSFTVIAVLTLALGIGVNITIFSVVNSVLLRPLPYPDADRLVFLWSDVPSQNLKERPTGYANISEWRNQNRSFEGLAFFDATSVTLTGANEPEQVQSLRTSADLFSLLGVSPLLGRTFTADEEQQRVRVVVLSYGLWQRRFGASPDIPGQTIEIDGVTSQIIGVMPEHFQFPEKATQLWEPCSLFPNWEAQKNQYGTGSWTVISKLKQPISLPQAQAEMSTIGRRLEQAYPNTNTGLGVNVVPFQRQFVRPELQIAIWILFGAVVFVLLMACTNVANLMLARGIAREREMAIRMALGAGRWRLIRQLLTESTLLALLAGMVGLLIAKFGIRALLSFSPPNIPHLETVGVDATVVAFTTIVSLLTGLLFGIVPALMISQSHPGKAMKEGRSSSGGIRGRRLRALFVVTEFSLAVLLLLGASLLVRSFILLQAVDYGFDPERVLYAQMSLPLASTSDQMRVFYQRMGERIATLPGVESVGLIKDIVISGNPDGLITVDRGSLDNLEQARIPFDQDLIDEGFFKTVRVPLRRGRFFSAQDNQATLPTAVINETMARRFWPEDDPIGKRFKFGPARSNAPWLTVIGVVGDMRRQGPERQPIAQIFQLNSQNPSRRMNLLVRTTVEPTQIAQAVRKEIYVIDKTVPIYGVSSLESRFERMIAERRFQTLLLALFSMLALLLAAIGIHGLMHQSVALRVREIGTRIALGAQPRDVLQLIVGQGMGLALAGIGIGLLAAIALTRVLSSLLFGVTSTDPTTFIATPLILLLVALIASYLPARRAVRLDPVTALRHE